MKVVILGAEVNNCNLGCKALTYSLLSVLNSFGDKYMNVCILEGDPDVKQTERMCKEIGMEEGKVSTVKRGNVTELLRGIRHIRNNWISLKKIKEADVIINVTQGDGFSDIYGKRRFNVFYGFLKYAIKCKKRIIMAPQTYGPFFSENVKKKAKYVIENADVVFSRDKLSADCIKEMANVSIIVTNDMAFQLPFDGLVRANEKKIIGINVSGLMAEKEQNSFNQHIDMAENYWEMICNLIEMCYENNFEIKIIPHVIEDVQYSMLLKNKYPYVDVVEFFDSPIEVKNEISKTDIFIGSRMHATIAALSSGVFTIPVAYSRKFEGVFDLIDYPYTVNLYEMDSSRAIEKIMDYINNYDEIDWGLINNNIDENNKLFNSKLKEVLYGNVSC